MSYSLQSWGRYPSHPQTAKPCYWRADLQQTLADMAAQHGTLLPFGNGRSYGDSCLATSGHALHMRPLDRFISANWESGLIRAEAGVTLGELLALAIPQGWFLPVTPGTQFVTLGGALANDVHGKNHHVRGTFGCHVPRFGLIRSDRPPLVCSRQENAELYAATIGGLGLTGIIEWLELQLVPIRSSLIDATHVRFGSLEEFFVLSAELDPKHEFAVSWIDCLARGKSVGRGIYMAANHAEEGPLVFANPCKLNVPLTPPFSAINRLSLRLLNSAYYGGHRDGRHNSRISYEPFFYPLDRILNWNRIYGPRGFQQYQCAIPEGNAAAATRELLDAIAAAHSGSFLAVLKRFGDVASPGLLSFPLPGATLALDFPQQGEITARLFSRLDTIVREAGGRLYPAKDAHMSGADFRNAYPAWAQYEGLRDPVLSSRFWERVTT
ncbi:FAD-binding oxidoreductase [Candidatus Nitrotoga arctica]|uniref:FAD-binding oxidoreductase n=1 Tax=Candidatus Nitrotoga arctica TaxID=453162 RepID=A0ABM8YYZ1_9PROT|nr:FAD-binding oxidoreductase [Candidatus Nitrotoga arctica]CAG9932807.1 FAD-binding oxidoreductase [Candidatus Nitrotoga arctica]